MDEIDRLLAAVYGHLQSQKHVKDNLQHKLHRKAEQREVQISKLLQYKGPDVDTINVLEQCSMEWLACPQRFWEHASFGSQAHSDPQVEVIRSFLHAAGDGA